MYIRRSLSPFKSKKDIAPYLETERKLAAIRMEICAIQSVVLPIRFCP